MTDQLTPEEVRGWRDQADMTLDQFAGALGVSRSTVIRWEKGEVDRPAWMALARDGWRARQLRANAPVLTEAEVRRIVREEMNDWVAPRVVR